MDPEPVFVYGAPSSSNIDIIMEEQLRDPDFRFKTPEQFQILLHYGLGRFLIWTGTQQSFNGLLRDAKADRLLERDLERALRQPYLVVVRTVRYQPAVLLGDKQYKDAIVDLEAFLIDARQPRILGSVRVHSGADMLVNAPLSYQVGSIYLSLAANTNRKLAKALAEIAGGNLVFEPEPQDTGKR